MYVHVYMYIQGDPPWQWLLIICPLVATRRLMVELLPAAKSCVAQEAYRDEW